MRVMLGRELAAALPPLLAPRARVVVESDRRSDPLELGLDVELRRRYGDTVITIHRHDDHPPPTMTAAPRTATTG